MYTPKDIALYFLSKVDEDSGDSISNLKLQKLVYYAQGFHLAIFDEPLFEDEIEAWMHGPVIPSLYNEYKDFGSNPIVLKEDEEIKNLDERTMCLLDEVYNVFGQFSAWKLRNLTHDEKIWEEAYNRNPRIITKEAMKAYFKTRVSN